jgi:hypothetical protein
MTMCVASRFSRLLDELLRRWEYLDITMVEYVPHRVIGREETIASSEDLFLDKSQKMSSQTSRLGLGGRRCWTNCLKSIWW